MRLNSRLHSSKSWTANMNLQNAQKTITLLRAYLLTLPTGKFPNHQSPFIRSEQILGEEIPYLSLIPPPNLMETLRTRPLRLDGTRRPKGLGARSEWGCAGTSKMHWHKKRPYRRLESESFHQYPLRPRLWTQCFRSLRARSPSSLFLSWSARDWWRVCRITRLRITVHLD